MTTADGPLSEVCLLPTTLRQLALLPSSSKKDTVNFSCKVQKSSQHLPRHGDKLGITSTIRWQHSHLS